jgi:hypothetical protein
MALCLLSRGLHFLVFLNLLSSLLLAKAMISLTCVSRLLQLFSSTPQPTRLESLFRRQFSYLHSSNCAHCSSHLREACDKRINVSFFESTWSFSYVWPALRSAASRVGAVRRQITALLDSLISASYAPALVWCQLSDIRSCQPSGVHRWALSAANCTTLFSPIDEPQPSLKSHVFTQVLSQPKLDIDPSPDRFSHNPPQCLVCDTQASRSCPVCGQNFCSTHLYYCADCDGQYCGNCLGDHDAEGHWTDSDTAAELSHTQRLGSKQAACQVRAMAVWACNYSRGPSSLPATVSQFISLFFSSMRSTCRDLFGPSFAAPSNMSQYILLLEVSL